MASTLTVYNFELHLEWRFLLENVDIFVLYNYVNQL